jgi:hypothetical protein
MTNIFSSIVIFEAKMVCGTIGYLLPFLQPLFITFADRLPCLYNLAAYALALLQNVQKKTFFLIKGTIDENSRTITTLFIGSEQSAHQFAYSTYLQITSITHIGKALAFQVIPSQNPNIDIVAVSEPSTSKYIENGYLLLPQLTFNLDLNRSIGEIVNRMTRRRRRDVKKLGIQGFSYKISTRKENDFDFFYWKMYLPYAQKRFGKAAQISNYSTLRAHYKRNGGIVFATRKEEPIAAILFQIRGNTLCALKIGASERNQNLKDLAGQATLFFLIRWAKEKGIKKLNYGLTVPFFNDGAFQYKKEWGMSVEKEKTQTFCALKLNPLSKDSLFFLEKNPCIICDKDRIKGVVLIDHRLGEEANLQQIASKHTLPKLEALSIICYDSRANIATGTDTPNAEECAKDIDKPLSGIFSVLRHQGFSFVVHDLPNSRSDIAYRDQSVEANAKINVALRSICHSSQ